MESPIYSNVKNSLPMGGYQVDLLGLRNGGLPWTGYTHSEHAHGWCGPEHMSHGHHVALDDFSALPIGAV